MNTELVITATALVLEIALLLYCRKKLKEPVDPAKPRLLPYGLIMLLLTVAIFVTIAHLVGLITGVRVEPKNKMKGR